MNHRVMITGLGVVSGFGLTTDEFWQGVSNGRCAIKPLPPIGDVKISVGATLPAYDETELFSNDELPLLDRHSQFSILAAEQAAADAGLKTAGALTNAAVVIGNAAGSKNTDEEVYATGCFQRVYRQPQKHGRYSNGPGKPGTFK